MCRCAMPGGWKLKIGLSDQEGMDLLVLDNNLSSFSSTKKWTNFPLLTLNNIGSLLRFFQASLSLALKRTKIEFSSTKAYLCSVR